MSLIKILLFSVAMQSTSSNSSKILSSITRLGSALSFVRNSSGFVGAWIKKESLSFFQALSPRVLVSLN